MDPKVSKGILAISAAVNAFCHEGIHLEDGVIGICSHEEGFTDHRVADAMLRLAQHCLDAYDNGMEGC